MSKMNMKLIADTIRCLAMDGVQKANSGHPGMPMGCADISAVLWTKILKHNPKKPDWPNRDRFVLSAGHGSMLLYSMLHLSGYDLPIDELKNFRQWGSKTPGHPEYGHTPGVETTTGPLGQGFCNGIGMALAEKVIASKFNDDKNDIIDHYIYGILGDGDLMEGVTAEAASLAGYWKLGNIIYIYDDNHISIEGSTDLTFSHESVEQRFQAYDWHTIKIDGHDHEAVEKAIQEAQGVKDKPSLIIARTTIAYGSPNKANSSGSHGSPLGEEEITLTKKNLGWEHSEPFTVPQEVKEVFDARLKELEASYDEWQKGFETYRTDNPEKAKLWDQMMSKEIKVDDSILPQFEVGKSIATRNSSGEVLQALSKNFPQLIGGSADLAPSNKTFIKDEKAITRDDYSGRNIHFGVREHGMGSILNGMALYGGTIPYGGTFLVFADYMRPPMRLAALMKLHVIYVFTHDSIFVGEDGPTHQPIEHLASLRSIPNLVVIRPAEATETAAAWKTAMEYKDGPIALLLTRQGLPTLDRKVYPSAQELEKGAYVLTLKDEKPDIILMASGSEVTNIIEAGEELAKENIKARVISFPSWELFEKQSEDYKKSVFPNDVPVRLAVETGLGMGWDKYVGDKGGIVSIDHFGASAPYKVLAKEFGFTTENIVKKAKELLK